MPTKKDDLQDDYYAQINKTDDASNQIKKPLKIKKPVLKKAQDISEKAHEVQEKKPKILARKKEAMPVSDEVVSEKVAGEVMEVEKPKARLVKREHASEGLLRSAMGQSTKTSPEKTEQKKPLIQFSGATAEFKPLENRPVMQTPEEERRAKFKERRLLEKNRKKDGFAPRSSSNNISRPQSSQ